MKLYDTICTLWAVNSFVTKKKTDDDYNSTLTCYVLIQNKENYPCISLQMLILNFSYNPLFIYVHSSSPSSMSLSADDV